MSDAIDRFIQEHFGSQRVIELRFTREDGLVDGGTLEHLEELRDARRRSLEAVR